MASRFWVGGTGTWDASDTTHWAASTGGAGGQSVPGSADTVTLDANSGGGTVTPNTTVTVQSITCGAFTGTLDFSANNNNVTLSANAGMNGSGSGTRTINLGNGTWTLTATGAGVTPWNFGTVTNLTFNANSSTIAFSGNNSQSRTFNGGGLTYNALSIGANTSGGQLIINGANTFASVAITAPNAIELPASTTTTITAAFNWAGSSSNQIVVYTSNTNLTSTISVASGSPTMSWVGLRNIVCTGGGTFTATNSFNLGLNTGITITAPTGGGSIDCSPVMAIISDRYRTVGY